MEQVMTWVNSSADTTPYFAPVLFIFFHIIRPFLFIPVGFICIAGGLMFGMTFGSIYSFIGVTLSSLIFYFFIKQMPDLFERFNRMREKIFGKHQAFNLPQVMLLRIIPFIHFHLISLCIIEMTRNFKEYAKASLVSNLPLAVVYTSFGQWFQSLQIEYALILLAAILILFYVIRKKEIIMKWEDFFQPDLQK
ncbi:alkaline phosphatase [Halalkalibacillus sediminis]|uniref:TVP38/TMEM64 family membrane protein n=1 Tax=Halalkalibacillus sediminis TaxID=2018042 RepID=A0A2I0QY30_9BACI|nr:VTT domain-containing protein [Halalkalibacillus sediminis]PKR79244.1 alkaline phosphatase [Halalkalibacillus sediminis]